MTITRKGILKEGHPCYHVTMGKTYVFTQETPDRWSVLNDKGITQILREDYIDFSCGAGREVLAYKYIVLEEDVGYIDVGTRCEVESINISGSYMVKSYTGNLVPVAPDRARAIPSLGVKRIPCSYPTFSQGLEPLLPPMPPKPPVPPVQVQACNPGEPMKPAQPPCSIELPEKPLPTPFIPRVLSGDMHGIIKKQKAVAQELLTLSMIMDHKAFIAGGAPRNWALNSAANDIDIFLRVPNGASEVHLSNVLEAFGITKIFNVSTHLAPGIQRPSPRSKAERQKHSNEVTRKSDQCIEFVLEGNYRNQKVQFIFLRPNAIMGLSYAVRYFDTSINMIVTYLTSEGDLIDSKSSAFNDTMKSGVIFVQENGSAYGNGDHLERIHSYFPLAPMVDEVYRTHVMADLNLVHRYAQPWEELIGKAARVNDF
ncbi:nucleotidyltransferase [Vibrio phage CHOED]|uniref:nucleotidyltransferase n=1 Tax=Vibrio phage CHOED TaxID=1458716 RepID=UPI00042F1928|nr:nucleotidyltransferase [Vibrio phage CHOED]AHK11882.1 hypothetical protein CHOED_022 [Vibrio phage CHOED]